LRKVKYNSWIEIGILPYVGNTTAVDGGYAYTGKIASELLNENVLAVLIPDLKQLFPYSIELKNALANPDPCIALTRLSSN
jgi:hypothetical protein